MTDPTFNDILYWLEQVEEGEEAKEKILEALRGEINCHAHAQDFAAGQLSTSELREFLEELEEKQNESENESENEEEVDKKFLVLLKDLEQEFAAGQLSTSELREFLEKLEEQNTTEEDNDKFLVFTGPGNGGKSNLLKTLEEQQKNTTDPKRLKRIQHLIEEMKRP
jgi:CRISPR/Cas system CSM-associated protein Csm2 small subunit